MKPDTTKQWHYTSDGVQKGPVSFEELKGIANSGAINQLSDKVWSEGLVNWIPATDVEGLFQSPPPSPVSRPSAVERPQRIKRASYPLFIILAFVSTITFFFGIGFAVVGTEEGEEGVAALGGLLILVGIALIIWLIVLWAIYIYRMWLILPRDSGRTTPGKAVGFMFIPFFSLYWVFVAFHGWSNDYNNFIKNNNITGAPQMSEGLFLAYSIFAALTRIPIINYLAIIPYWIIFLIVFNKVCKAINYFANA